MAGSVKAIDKQSVHRICSGQVVLNLATAVKELVENALDAGATNIDIRLKEYGSEILEVADNASGVEENNFQGLTLKHHTSKLKDFSDLSSVDTFGFRGEALSSLCALSDMTVITCHKSASVGTRLVYDHSGRLTRQTPSPRQQGTTVSLQNLFSTLPVRHKEFLRNLKKEFTRMVQLLQAYGIISSGVKLTCSNQVGQGKRSPVLTTSGNTLLKENIANVFGPKQLQSLLEFSQLSPNAEQCEEYGLTEQQLQDQLFRLTGYISKSDHGQGRGSSDRQYLYINRRPCDFPKVSKLINEVYHMYNRHQYPFVVLDISLAKDSVDVNVTPDKRKIFVLEGKSLLAVLKASLIAMFEPRSALYDVNSQMKSSLATTKTSTGGTLSPFPRPTLSNGTSTEDCKPDYKGLKVTLAGLKRSFSHTGSSSVNNKLEEESRAAKQPRLDSYLLKRSNTEPKYFTTDHLTSTPENPKSTNGRLLPGITENRSLQKELKSGTLDRDNKVHYVGSEPNILRTKETNEFSSVNDSSKSSLDAVNGESVNSEILSEQSGPFEVAANCARDQGSDNQSEALNLAGNSLKDQSQLSGDELSSSRESTDHSRTCVGIFRNSSEDSSLEDGTVSPVHVGNEEHDIKMGKCRETAHSEKQGLQTVLTMDDSSFEHSASKKEVIVPFSFQGVSERLKETEVPSCGPKVLSRTFKATITPSENGTAEEELKKHVSKDMFPSMEILGQFNLGFIIAKHNRDLFIIDQHATDEKYNFEMLQRHTALQGQKLIQPMQLELTAVSESILIDNLEIFKKNGFDFTVDEDAPPTSRVKLVSVPVSKNWTFGKDDIDEVIFMLSDCPGVMCRPTRVRQMFASRSCRKSIMIGTALDKREMQKVLNHMAEIDQPWNCPHGRPTMRHLFNLDMLPD